jgi:hypothetical protein
MTIIEIRPFRNGWQVYEAPGVQPVFLSQEQAIDYAQSRAGFRSGEVWILDFNWQSRADDPVQRNGEKNVVRD